MISSLLFLGTGASMGVPVIGCTCEVCTSKSPFNKRQRTSVLLKIGQKRLLIDTGTDLREQALKNHINSIDGVIYTHSHQDHTAGIDDLRIYVFLKKESVPCLASIETKDELIHRYPFMFKDQPLELGKPRLYFETLGSDRGKTVFCDIELSYFTYSQLGMNVTGYRFGNLAYITDIFTYPESIWEDIQGVDTLIISALKYTPSHMHLTVDQAVDFAVKSKAKTTYLTHLSHDLDYYKTTSYLPENIKLAYDGLEILFEG